MIISQVPPTITVAQRVAHWLAERDRYTWQLHPTAAQQRKQDRYMTDAERLLVNIDNWRVSTPPR
jgi:hypothetical protein